MSTQKSGVKKPTRLIPKAYDYSTHVYFSQIFGAFFHAVAHHKHLNSYYLAVLHHRFHSDWFSNLSGRCSVEPAVSICTSFTPRLNDKGPQLIAKKHSKPQRTPSVAEREAIPSHLKTTHENPAYLAAKN